MRKPKGTGLAGWRGDQTPRPMAVTAEEAAEQLGIPLPLVREYCQTIEPYHHADGSERWPLREIRQLHANTVVVMARAK
jgi:hypothetical protein